MLIKLKFYSLTILFLVNFLEASHCRLPEALVAWADKQFSPEINLYQASRFGSSDAEQKLLQIALETEQSHWLVLLAENGNPQAHYHLALLAERPSLKNRHLLKAAKDSYAPALFELGISESSPKLKVQYLQDAAEQGLFPAQKALYQWHWFHEDYTQGLPWLQQVAETDGDAALTLALFLWRTGEHEAALDWFESSLQNGNKDAGHYQRLISKYWQKNSVNVESMANTVGGTSENSCAMQLQFIATSLDSIKQAQSYYKEFKRDERFEGLPICINPPVWFQDEEFVCQSRPLNNYRITCPLAHIEKYLTPNSFTHLVVFAEQGKANVVNGVMYLDLADKYSVFIHELAHFVGFIDEYPLSPEFAGFFCSGEQTFPNIVVVPEDGSLDNLDLQYWQSQSNEISLSRANTCNNHPAQAYKFDPKLTFMEFHDTDYIPQFYLNIWRQKLTDKSNIRIAAINIAQSLEEHGNTPAAKKWWDLFENWRSQGN